MNPNLPPIRKPRCFLVYALAPESLPAAEANRLLNAYTADPRRGLALYHDHFIGQKGGVVVFFVESEAQRQALLEPAGLEGWQVAIHPLIFSYSPSAFDEQIAFTLRSYRGADWEALRQEQRPSYGNPRLEAETAREEA
jgi:hypothetical protein